MDKIDDQILEYFTANEIKRCTADKNEVIETINWCKKKGFSNEQTRQELVDSYMSSTAGGLGGNHNTAYNVVMADYEGFCGFNYN